MNDFVCVEIVDGRHRNGEGLWHRGKTETAREGGREGGGGDTSSSGDERCSSPTASSADPRPWDLAQED